jgi:hypothetical protein
MPFMSFDYDMTKASSDVLFGASSLDVTLLIGAGDNNYMVDWGDGTTTTNNPSHTYATDDTRTITVSGRLPGGITFSTNNIDAAHNGEKRLTKVNTALLKQDSDSMKSLFCGCANLASLPEDLFDSNTQVTDFTSLFLDCTGLTSIPENLFANNTQATSFDVAFYGCTNLASVPEDLFAKNTQVTTFAFTFQGCTALATIPDNLFANNTQAMDFGYAFQGCTGLTTIPATLFANNTQVTSFYSAFQGCTGLTTIPATLFDNNIHAATFNYAFQGCTGIGSSTDLPDWWNDAKYPEATYPQFHLTAASALRMFTGCANAKNYSSVPTTPLVWR